MKTRRRNVEGSKKVAVDLRELVLVAGAYKAGGGGEP